MVESAGTPPRPDSLRPLNPPAPIAVEVDRRPYPVRVKLGEGWHKVVSVDDLWEVDGEWWREQPVRRRYYRVTLRDRGSLTLFQDLVAGEWYQQRE